MILCWMMRRTCDRLSLLGRCRIRLRVNGLAGCWWRRWWIRAITNGRWIRIPVGAIVHWRRRNGILSMAIHVLILSAGWAVHLTSCRRWVTAWNWLMRRGRRHSMVIHLRSTSRVSWIALWSSIWRHCTRIVCWLV